MKQALQPESSRLGKSTLLALAILISMVSVAEAQVKKQVSPTAAQAQVFTTLDQIYDRDIKKYPPSIQTELAEIKNHCAFRGGHIYALQGFVHGFYFNDDDIPDYLIYYQQACVPYGIYCDYLHQCRLSLWLSGKGQHKKALDKFVLGYTPRSADRALTIYVAPTECGGKPTDREPCSIGYRVQDSNLSVEH